MSEATAPTTFSLRELIDARTRLHQHAIGLIAVVFLAIYGRLVCPFINGLGVPELLSNLLLVFVVQVAVRETLLLRYPDPPADRSLARHGYLLSVAAWIIAGATAMVVHMVRYEDFPLASHIKLLSAYWILGAGLLAQWEYVVLEREARLQSVRYVDARQYPERITRRVMEGFVLFTVAPSIAMALTMARYQFEGLVDMGMVAEISFLGGFCVLVALGVASRFGASLRADAESVVQGTQRIRAGAEGVTLDSSRLDEFGEVASGINRMCRELEARKTRLEKQLVERAAMTRVSLAISSLMAADQVLDLIVGNATLVCGAEAASLLLIDETGEQLRFHVAHGEAGAELGKVRIPLGAGIAGTVAASGEALLIPDAYADPRFDPAHDRRTGFRTRSLLTVPLLSKARVLGVVQVVNKASAASFDEADRELLESFAAQAAVSLENARLFADTVRMAEDLRVALENERNLAIEKEKMGAYIPKQLVDEISRNREEKLALGGRTVVATMLFSDIKGFTALSETLDPQEIVGFLNVYMTAMTDIIESEGGIVDKFMGDGIMAVFTDQCPLGQELCAVRAGVRMQRTLAVMRAQDATVSHLQMRVGINTGTVVAGNIGSQTRMDYTVIGDNVNVASRIEGAAPPDGVLVSERTWEGVADQFEAAQQPPIQVKNRREPVRTWLVVPCDVPAPDAETKTDRAADADTGSGRT